MELLKTDTACTAMRLPHGTNALLRAWHRALALLLDSRATLVETEEMYAVFEEESAGYALAMLSIAFSRYACAAELGAEELPDKILFRLTGRRRTENARLTQQAVLPKEENCRRALEDFLSRSGMAYTLAETEDTLCLSVALPRFLADRYDVSAVNDETLCDRFYDAMLLLSGDEPKHPLPI